MWDGGEGGSFAPRPSSPAGMGAPGQAQDSGLEGHRFPALSSFARSVHVSPGAAPSQPAGPWPEGEALGSFL